MRRFAAHLGRTLVASASAAVLIAAGCSEPAHAQGPIVRPGVSASQFWPRPGTATWPDPPFVECPAGTEICRFELTPDYWRAFRACRVERSHAECRDSIPAEYVVGPER